MPCQRRPLERTKFDEVSVCVCVWGCVCMALFRGVIWNGFVEKVVFIRKAA